MLLLTGLGFVTTALTAWLCKVTLDERDAALAEANKLGIEVEDQNVELATLRETIATLRRQHAEVIRERDHAQTELESIRRSQLQFWQHENEEEAA